MTLIAGHLARILDTETGTTVVAVATSGGWSPLPQHETVSALLATPVDEIRRALEDAGPPIAEGRVRLLPPVDGPMEVWGAGVTYLVSREAREEESEQRAVYRKVYDSPRPELFFKAAAWRAVTDGEPISVRSDSANNVPEPEMGLVLNRQGSLVGYTIVNDVSSRAIEGENPLYLPQAKIYDGSCAVGPTIAPHWVLEDVSNLSISMTIVRDEVIAYSGSALISDMKRTFDELARFLFSEQSFPCGVVLATGTGVIPPLSFTIVPGDVIQIEVEGLGRQVCQVTTTDGVGRWLWARHLRPMTAPLTPAKRHLEPRLG